MADALTEVLSAVLGLIGVLSTIYGFTIQGPQRLIALILGIIITCMYTKWFITRHINNNIERIREEVTTKMGQMNEKIETIKNEISYVKGFLHSTLKNKKGAINPIWLIMITLIAIIIILYYQGKL